MGKISIDLSTIKSAGIYTIEIDNSQREVTNPTSLRLLPGFNNKGPFNRPVFMQYESERQKIFGDIDSKLEQKGCFFNRMAQTMLKNGPILALNLLKVDDSIDGPDQVNYATMSLDSCKPNPKVTSAGKTYGEYDYQAATINNKLYGSKQGDVIPYVGKTPYASLFDRARFWIPSKNNLQAVAANGLLSNDQGSYEHTNLLNFANTGTDEISILVYKPENVTGYNVTAKEWWGGDENIPYGWIRPSDYISDYFIRVVAIKGNWTNYPVLASDPIWSKYFDKNGVIKNKVSSLCSAEGVTFIGSWTGSIIPDFVDKQGNYMYIESKVNANTERTGLLMSVNEDALQVISYDKNGVDIETGNENGTGTWVFDFDGNKQAESELGESSINESGYLVDMVGHNLQNGIYADNYYLNLAHPLSNEQKLPDESVLCYTYYFQKTQASCTKDLNAWCMSFNGRDTLSTEDDVVPAAKIRVLYCKNQSIDTKKFVKAYSVYNAETNQPVKANNSKYGANFYIMEEYNVDEKKSSLSAELQNCLTKPLTDLTNESGKKTLEAITTKLKALPVYAQPNLKVSYNINDVVYKLDNKNKFTTQQATVADVISKDAKYLYIKEVPVTSDTNDNYVYEDKTMYYGTYAIPTVPAPKQAVEADADNANDKVEVKLFSVIAGTKANSYAIIHDLGTITTTTATNKLIPVEITNYKDSKADTGTSTKAQGFTFSYGGNDYFVRGISAIPQTGGIYTAMYKLVNSDTPTYFGVNFMSYNYITEHVSEVITNAYNAYYFNGYKNTSSVAAAVNLQTTDLYDEGTCPVTDTNLNSFIITNETEANNISVGDYVNNISFYNNVGEAEKYNLIPGITRVITKVFVNVDARNEFYYKGSKYHINIGALGDGNLIETTAGKRGFYLFTTLDPVYISDTNYVVRQKPITDDSISHNLKFIPLKGLHISAKHRPGFDEYGKLDIEGGIEKIYSMLQDDGIHRGLCNPNMVDYRYIVDSMSYGLTNEMGGKKYLSILAMDRMKTTALLNLPSKRQFELSVDPCFCDTYDQGVYTKPSFDTKYIPQGGNTDMYSTTMFSLPTEDDGSKFAAAFWPHLVYNVNGRKINVPPAADVCDVLIRKFNGGDPYVIAANRNGIIKNTDVVGIEFNADTTDRDYLEPFGVNTIIQEGNNILIYGNQTCYQNTKSDFNKLHVRENLNTLEIACEDVLKRYNFLYNTPAVRASVVTALTPILETMKLSNAIESYEIICDESNNTPDIIAEDYGIVDIAVTMSHGMEKIVQRITLNRRDTLQDR